MKFTTVILFIAIGSLVIPNLGISQPRHLFSDTAILKISIKGDVRSLMKDRGDDPQYHSLTLSYKEADNSDVTLPVKIKARGHFRKLRENCTYPPLLLNFDGQKENTIFSEQGKVKLVTACRGDKYVVREYLIYKLYNLVTPKSFNVRLVQISFEDTSAKPLAIEPFSGILIEEEEQMANRNNATSVEAGKIVRPEQTQLDDFLNMAVFEYLIANTDWSVQYLQNVKLIASPGQNPSPVPYDFDHAGIVQAPYAKPAEELLLTSIRERRYRGYCMKVQQVEETIARFNGLKEKILATYSGSTLLDDGYKKATLKFLEEFFKTINNPRKWKSEFEYPCRADGTGNVVIQGLKKN